MSRIKDLLDKLMFSQYTTKKYLHQQIRRKNTSIAKKAAQIHKLNKQFKEAHAAADVDKYKKLKELITTWINLNMIKRISIDTNENLKKTLATNDKLIKEQKKQLSQLELRNCLSSWIK